MLPRPVVTVPVKCSVAAPAWPEKHNAANDANKNEAHLMGHPPTGMLCEIVFLPDTLMLLPAFFGGQCARRLRPARFLAAPAAQSRHPAADWCGNGNKPGLGCSACGRAPPGLRQRHDRAGGGFDTGPGLHP